MFPNTLDDLPYKWHKIEEAHGETFTWKDLKENFIKDFAFTLQEANLTKAVKEIGDYIEKPSAKVTQEKGNYGHDSWHGT